MREALEFFGAQVRNIENVNGEEIELTFESNIGMKLLEQANEGDLKAIELLSKMFPNWLQATKIDLKADIGAIKYMEVVK